MMDDATQRYAEDSRKLAQVDPRLGRNRLEGTLSNVCLWTVGTVTASGALRHRLARGLRPGPRRQSTARALPPSPCRVQRGSVRSVPEGRPRTPRSGRGNSASDNAGMSPRTEG